MTETDNDTERRQHKRFDVPEATVQFRKSSGGPPRRYACPIQNLGRGGVVFVSPIELAPDERMVLTLNLPKKSNYLKLVSRCRWCRPMDEAEGFLVGAVFDKYGASTAKRLVQLEMQFGFLGATDERAETPDKEIAAADGSASPSLSRDDVPPEFAEVLKLFQDFKFDLGAAKDVLDVLAKGGDFDMLTRDQDDDERSEMLRTLVPVHEMGESVPAAFDSLGVPIGEPISYVFMPNTNATSTFALQINRTAALSPGPPRFAKRDVLLFSSEPAKDYDHAFVVAGNQAWFGQVFFDNEGEVRVRPPNEDFGECLLRLQEVAAIWRMSGKVEHY